MCLSKNLFKLVGFAFVVDDVDLIQSGEDKDEVLDKTKSLLDEKRQLQEELLRLRDLIFNHGRI